MNKALLSILNVALFVMLNLLPFTSVFGQRFGDYDRSYNFGYGPGYDFKSGSGFQSILELDFFKSLSLPDGKVIVTGNFIKYDENPAKNIVRLNNDGTYDDSFIQNDSLFIEDVKRAILNADGSFYLVGSFHYLNNSYSVLRFEANGSVDLNFIYNNVDDQALDIVQLTNGNVVILYSIHYNTQELRTYTAAGSFLSLLPFVNNHSGWGASLLPQANNNFLLLNLNFPKYSVFKINQYGVVDTTFKLKRNHMFKDIKVLSDGSFYAFNNGVSKYNVDGSLDTISFRHFNFSSTPSVWYVLPDNSFYLTHSKFNYAGDTFNILTHFRANGTPIRSISNAEIDNHFVFGNSLIHVNSNGRLSIFLKSQLNKEIFHKNGVYIFNPDLSYNAVENFPKVGSNSFITSSVRLPDNSLLYAGCFTYFNRYRVNHIVKVKENGEVDTNFKFSGYNVFILDKVMFNSAINKIYIFGSMRRTNERYNSHLLLRLNLDGTVDTSYNFSFPLHWEMNFEQLESGKTLFFTNVQYDFNRIYAGPLRMNVDGRLDDSFNSSFEWRGRGFLKMKELSNRKILVYGKTSTFNSVDFPGVVQLQENGATDASFNFTYPNLIEVNNIVQASNNRLYLTVTVRGSNNLQEVKLISINTDGSIDENFNSFTSVSSNFAPNVKLLVDEGYVYLFLGLKEFITSFNGKIIYKFDLSGNLVDSVRYTNFNNYNVRVNDCMMLNAGRISIVGSFHSFQGLQVANSAIIHTGCNIPLAPRAPRIRIIQDASLPASFARAEVINPVANAHYSWNNGAVGASIVAKNADTLRVKAQINGCLSLYSNRAIVNSSEDDFLSKVMVYPNPAKEVVKVSVPANVCYEIHNILGIRFQSGILNAFETNELDVSKLQRGVYILSFLADSRKYSIKLMVE